MRREEAVALRKQLLSIELFALPDVAGIVSIDLQVTVRVSSRAVGSGLERLALDG